MNSFETHTGEIVTGQPLQDALDKVASDWEELAKSVRKEDDYASHVSEFTKDDILRIQLVRAESIRNGEIRSFAIWQRVNTYLTGDCVALLPK